MSSPIIDPHGEERLCPFVGYLWSLKHVCFLCVCVCVRAHVQLYIMHFSPYGMSKAR